MFPPPRQIDMWVGVCPSSVVVTFTTLRFWLSALQHHEQEAIGGYFYTVAIGESKGGGTLLLGQCLLTLFFDLYPSHLLPSFDAPFIALSVSNITERGSENSSDRESSSAGEATPIGIATRLKSPGELQHQNAAPQRISDG